MLILLIHPPGVTLITGPNYLKGPNARLGHNNAKGPGPILKRDVYWPLCSIIFTSHCPTVLNFDHQVVDPETDRKCK